MRCKMHYDEQREKKWCDTGTTPSKDKKMAMTQKNFYRVIAMRDEIIFEQKEQIAKLKIKINKIELKYRTQR